MTAPKPPVAPAVIRFPRRQRRHESAPATSIAPGNTRKKNPRQARDSKISGHENRITILTRRSYR